MLKNWLIQQTAAERVHVAFYLIRFRIIGNSLLMFYSFGVTIFTALLKLVVEGDLKDGYNSV